MSQCECGSYSINPGIHGRDKKTDLHLCDVCYWRKRAAVHVNNLPQGVEEFISGNRKRVCDPDGCFLGYAIPEHFLSDWMSGHVRVPVELLRKRFESPNTIDQCEAEAEFLALLNASKGE